MGQAKRGELKRAARQLGVTSTTLRQHGWKTASPARVRAARDNPPDWLAAAREHRSGKHQRRDRVSTAARLGIQARAVRECDIEPGEVGRLLAKRPGWLIAERRQAQIAREADDKLRRELTDALVTSVHEVWSQELKTAVSDAEVAAIDAGGRLRSAGPSATHDSWRASCLLGRCGRGSAGNGTPPTRRPATVRASSCGGRWRGDGGQVQGP
jgi:hypothetical protein